MIRGENDEEFTLNTERALMKLFNLLESIGMVVNRSKTEKALFLKTKISPRKQKLLDNALSNDLKTFEAVSKVRYLHLEKLGLIRKNDVCLKFIISVDFPITYPSAPL